MARIFIEIENLLFETFRSGMCNPMARGPDVALQTVFCGPQVRWAIGKKCKTAFDK